MALQDVSLLIDSPRKKKSTAFRAWQDALLQHKEPIRAIASGIGVHPNTLYNAINCRQEPSFEMVVSSLKHIGLQIKYEKLEKSP